MPAIAADGLMDKPPVSYTMPFPTKTVDFVPFYVYMWVWRERRTERGREGEWEGWMDTWIHGYIDI